MNLEFSKEEEAFRSEVKAFLAENLSAEMRDNKLDQPDGKELMTRWQKLLFEKGWIAPDWPEEYGGPGWSITKKYIFDCEMAAAGAPTVIPFGLKMVGPVIYTFGTEDQKKRFLPKILNSDEWWCQGYSEPGAGSDLASLKTTAKLEGDHYVVNGQKIWTSLAQYADWIFCLVRTSFDGKPQQGISFLLIDMNTPGIEVRKIISIDNKHTLNEVFFTDVKVPAANLIGEENKGWSYAKFLLGHERAEIAGIAKAKRAIERIRRIAANKRRNNFPLIEDPLFKSRLAKIEAELMSLEFTEIEMIADMAEGKSTGGIASVLKIRGSEIQQAITELAIEAGGMDCRVLRGEGQPETDFTGAITDYLYGRAITIYGGSNEIQRNIIAKAVLGL